jgi:hypothetical protein
VVSVRKEHSHLKIGTHVGLSSKYNWVLCVDSLTVPSFTTAVDSFRPDDCDWKDTAYHSLLRHASDEALNFHPAFLHRLPFRILSAVSFPLASAPSTVAVSLPLANASPAKKI